MKTSVAALVLLSTVLTAGLALAQMPPQPRGGASVAPHARSASAPALGCQPDSVGDETRATVNSSGVIVASEKPVNGVGGQGGGRLANRDHIDQDAMSASQRAGTGGRSAGGAQAAIPATRTNCNKLQ